MHHSTCTNRAGCLRQSSCFSQNGRLGGSRTHKTLLLRRIRMPFRHKPILVLSYSQKPKRKDRTIKAIPIPEQIKPFFHPTTVQQNKHEKNLITPVDKSHISIYPKPSQPSWLIIQVWIKLYIPKLIPSNIIIIKILLNILNGVGLRIKPARGGIYIVNKNRSSPAISGIVRFLVKIFVKITINI